MREREKVAGIVMEEVRGKRCCYGRGRVLLQNYEERMRGKTKSGGIVMEYPTVLLWKRYEVRSIVMEEESLVAKQEDGV